jgi:hypothetical protein
MNISTELLVGIILIAMGLLLGGVAYLVLSSRGGEPSEGEEDPSQDALEAEDDLDEGPIEFEEDLAETEEITEVDLSSTDEPVPDLPEDVLDEPEDELEIVSEVDPELPSVVQEPPDPELELEEEPEDERLEQSEPEPELVQEVTPQPGPQIQVATLLRDDVTGELIVRVGDREYLSADELRVSKDWTRVEFAAADLAKWIEQPVSRPVPEREVEPLDRSQPQSMIEQINAILQDKIEASGKSHLAVRLIEGQEGTARVLIGVHSYDLGEVPDESISELIREAVADWEAGA